MEKSLGIIPRFIDFLMQFRTVRTRVTDIIIQQFVPSDTILSKNKFGVGGQDINSLYKKSWAEIDPSESHLEVLFFSYIGPLESWCQRHTTEFFLTSDKQGVMLILPQNVDQLVFNIKYGGELPTLRNLEQLQS